MLRYLSILLLLVVMAGSSFGQDAKSDKALLDSILKNDPLFQQLDSIDVATSTALVGIGLGNKLFSSRNNQLNILQEENKLILTPSLGYYHRSGFGLSLSANLLNEKNKTAFYQFSISPSYDLLTNKNFDAGISYSRYFVKEEFLQTVSPIKHELFGYFMLKKNWIVPGLSLGYATGNYEECFKADTVIGIVRIHLTDTVKTTIKSFSLSGSIEHSFKWFGFLSDEDAIMVKPQFFITAGSNTYKETHRGAAIFLDRNTGRRNRVGKFDEASENSGLKLQSVSAAVSLNYMFKNITVRPGIYLDYYLPETDGDRLATIFNLSFSYSLF